jgi:hypothetical protein
MQCHSKTCLLILYLFLRHAINVILGILHVWKFSEGSCFNFIFQLLIIATMEENVIPLFDLIEQEISRQNFLFEYEHNKIFIAKCMQDCTCICVLTSVYIIYRNPHPLVSTPVTFVVCMLMKLDFKK